jgi:exopolysaccharide biosynthesis polyprenyl glycosylphosphotransferase
MDQQSLQSAAAGNLSPQRDQIVVIGHGNSTEVRQSIPSAFDPSQIFGASSAKGDVVLGAVTEAGGARSFAPEVALTGAGCTIKRVFDLVVATTAIVWLLPILVVAAIAVAVDTPGPIFFLQWRGGRNGRRFRIMKFRTMTCMEDGAEVCQARQFDPRVTRIGRALRQSSIDELPQLFNVLRGDMSIVGPRPHALVHDAIYSKIIPNYAARQSVKPGITGWAQVNGCRGETREVAAMARRVERDLEYIQHWSLQFDLKILAMTVSELLRPKNTY